MEDNNVNGTSKPKVYRQYEDNTVSGKKTSKLQWFAFGCLASIGLVFLSFILIVLLAVTSRRTPDTPRNSILNIVISGAIQEHKEVDQDIFSITKTPSLREIIKKIHYAANDPAIDAILLEPRFMVTGMPAVNELNEVIQEFRATGKKVYAYLEIASNTDYHLASTTDRIFLNPASSSGIYLSGVGISSLYMKDLLDKLGIQMTVLHSGKYKGAGEELSRQTMSREMRESLNTVLDDFYDNIISDISDRRLLAREDVRRIFEEREDVLINGQYALDSGLVDSLLGRDDLVAQMKGDKSNLLKLSNYNPKEQPKRKGDAVAVVYLQGMITTATESIFDRDTYITSAKVKRILDRVEKDNRVKAVVLRVDSPGGSALESDIIYHRIAQINANKPVVVSMGRVAASGGYYISAPSDYIVADPYTLTGSIGVAAMIPNLHKMGKSIGVNPQSMQRGKFSNFMNGWEAPKEQDINALQRNLDKVYDEFLTRVADGRGMAKSDLGKAAEGRIWTSKRALELGLIDEIGTLSTAIDKAVEMGELTQYNVITYPQTKTFIEILMEKRFNLTALQDRKLVQMLPKQFADYFLKLYRVIKDDPIQLLSPIIIVEQ